MNVTFASVTPLRDRPSGQNRAIKRTQAGNIAGPSMTALYVQRRATNHHQKGCADAIVKGTAGTITSSTATRKAERGSHRAFRWAERWPAIRILRESCSPYTSGGKWPRLSHDCRIEPFAGCSALSRLRSPSIPLTPAGRARTKAPAACWGFHIDEYNHADGYHPANRAPTHGFNEVPARTREICNRGKTRGISHWSWRACHGHPDNRALRLRHPTLPRLRGRVGWGPGQARAMTPRVLPLLQKFPQ